MSDDDDNVSTIGVIYDRPQSSQQVVFIDSQDHDLFHSDENLANFRPYTPAMKTPTSRPFTPIPIGPPDYIRPLSAPEIPAKFDMYATVDEALKGVMPLQCDDDGNIVGIHDNRSRNFTVTAHKLSSITAVNHFISNISNHADEIFGLYFNGLKIEEKNIDELISGIVEFGKFKYLVDLDLSYIFISYVPLYRLCDILNPKKSGYCPIKRLMLTRCGLGSKGMLYLLMCLFLSV